MNVNELYAVKVLNIEDAMKDAPEYASGTFKKICDGIYNGTISLLSDAQGNIIGGNYNSGKTGAEDSIEQMKFEREYAGLPLMTYVEKAVQLYVNHVQIAEICESRDEIYVIDSNGERHDIYTKSEDADEYWDEDELPEEIALEDLGLDEEDEKDMSDRSLRKAIKNHTGYFVARDAELVVDHGYVINITYGRKASQSELD